MTDLPAALRPALHDLLAAHQFAVHMLGSGVARVSAKGDAVVVKWSSAKSPPPDWPTPLAAEAHGLQLLAATRAVRVPAQRRWQPASRTEPEYLVLDWIAMPDRPDRAAVGQQLGYDLARLHEHGAAIFGLEQHNYCGATPQPNHPAESWLAFFRERRLGFQAALAATHGRLSPQRGSRIERVMQRIDEWIDDAAVRPALLHGDLWGGNWLIGVNNASVLIDPAVSYGDAEFDLAMCRLFGGFPASFFAAYDEAQPPRPGRDERVPLYQLYHVLNHLNLFGEGYGSQVDDILRHLVG